MKSFHSRFLPLCAALLGIIIFCSACYSTPAPVVINLTPDFSTVELPAVTSASAHPDLLAQPGRVAIYANTCFNYGSNLNPDFVTKYQYLDDCQNFFWWQNQLALPTQIDFFWYGYSATAQQEEINLRLQPGPDSTQRFFIITSSLAEQETIIYKSCTGKSSSVKAALSSGYQTKIYTRDQFAEATAAGDLPDTLTTYYFPSDADYICKASFQIDF